MKKLLIYSAMALFACASVASAQSPLAEAARREAARRKTMETVKAPAAPTFTNDDLAKLPPRPAPVAPLPATEPTTVGVAGAVPPTPAADPAAAAAPGAPGAAAPAAPRDEKYWRERITTARNNLSRAEIFAESLQSRINALSTDLVNRDDPAQRQKIAADRQRALTELSKVQAEIADFKKAITDIETEARRTGVPAGWLR